MDCLNRINDSQANPSSHCVRRSNILIDKARHRETARVIKWKKDRASTIWNRQFRWIRVKHNQHVTTIFVVARKLIRGHIFHIANTIEISIYMSSPRRFCPSYYECLLEKERARKPSTPSTLSCVGARGELIWRKTCDRFPNIVQYNQVKLVDLKRLVRTKSTLRGD